MTATTNVSVNNVANINVYDTLIAAEEYTVYHIIVELVTKLNCNIVCMQLVLNKNGTTNYIN